MNLSKITSDVTTGIRKGAKVAKKAIQAASEEIQQQKKLQKEMDFQSAINKALVNIKTATSRLKKVNPSDIADAKAAKQASEGINKFVFGEEQDQVRRIATSIVNRYDDISPQDATKGAIELVKATGLQSGKSAEISANVMGSKKNELELQLDLKDLKAELLKKKAARNAEKLAKETETVWH